MGQISKFLLFIIKKLFSDVAALTGGVKQTIEDLVGLYNLGIYYIGGEPQPAVQRLCTG